jgi:hypothetical protein
VLDAFARRHAVAGHRQLGSSRPDLDESTLVVAQAIVTTAALPS